jgi:hypothetical protein
MAAEYLIHLAHIFIFSLFLAYIGIAKTNIPSFVYPIALFTGLLIIIYHIYKSIFKKDAWINYIHIGMIGPLLIYIGYMKESTPKKAFEFALMLAFASFGYHLYYLVQ